MKKDGIELCEDLQKFDREELETKFGSFGERLYHLCRGIDNRAVQTDRIRKSVSVENTYPKDLKDLHSCLEALPELAMQLNKRLQRLENRYRIHKQFVKIKFSDFSQTTVEMLSDAIDMDNYLQLCSEGFTRGDRPVRLLGLGVRVSPVSDEQVAQDRVNQLALNLD